MTLSRKIAIGCCIAGLIAITLTWNAAADSPRCAARTAIVDALSTKYGEAVIATGVIPPGLLIEVLASEDGATWTILMSHPEGQSCVMATGEDWQPVMPLGDET